MWVEVLTTAFALQLLALPGEKGQLVIAGLATVYNPYTVVAGAATAFGGWTVLEILLGDALRGALPIVYLDAMTVGLFVLFAFWIIYNDAGTESADRDVSGDASALSVGAVPTSNSGGYLSSFSTMAVAEFGDKTQLITITLAARYGAHPAIWVGEMLAIVPVSLFTAVFFSRTARYLNLAWIRLGAAAMFLLFSADIASSYLLGISFLPL